MCPLDAAPNLRDGAHSINMTTQAASHGALSHFTHTVRSHLSYSIAMETCCSPGQALLPLR
jgi:hypothetical protein